MTAIATRLTKDERRAADLRLQEERAAFLQDHERHEEWQREAVEHRRLTARSTKQLKMVEQWDVIDLLNQTNEALKNYLERHGADDEFGSYAAAVRHVIFVYADLLECDKETPNLRG
jgi:hypothetical protein